MFDIDFGLAVTYMITYRQRENRERLMMLLKQYMVS